MVTILYYKLFSYFWSGLILIPHEDGPYKNILRVWDIPENTIDCDKDAKGPSI